MLGLLLAFHYPVCSSGRHVPEWRLHACGVCKLSSLLTSLQTAFLPVLPFADRHIWSPLFRKRIDEVVIRRDYLQLVLSTNPGASSSMPIGHQLRSGLCVAGQGLARLGTTANLSSASPPLASTQSCRPRYCAERMGLLIHLGRFAI